MHQNRYLIIQGISISNVNKEEIDNHGRIKKKKVTLTYFLINIIMKLQDVITNKVNEFFVMTTWHRNGKCLTLHICNRVNSFMFSRVCILPVCSPRVPCQHFETISRRHFKYYTLKGLHVTQIFDSCPLQNLLTNSR